MSGVSRGSARAALSLGLCVAFAASLVYVFTRERDAPEIATTPATTAVAAKPAPAVETVARAPVTEAPAAEAEAPSVDVVRVEPGGTALVAGRAAPGTTVTVYAEEKEIGAAKTDAEGNFVAIFDAKPSAAPRALTLGSETPEGEKAVSDQVVLLLPETPAPAAGSAETRAEEPAAEASEKTATVEVAATAIVSAGSVAVTPVARPTGAAANRVSLVSISYAEAGEVTLAGFGLAGSELRAYVDDAFARDGRVDTEGRWSIALGDVAAGIYRLRIDQLSSDGKVSSRIETPFKRDFPPPVAGSGSEAGRVSLVVQPGNNLWTLARIHYGAGMLYTQIFTANSDLIGDPDLIYPGQIFRLPKKQAVE